MDSSEQKDLILELIGLPKETEWIEFKRDNAGPDMIGKNVSALSNSAALIGKPYAYIIWGIENETHNVIGTKFQPRQKKVGNEELENWLLKLLNPRVDFRIRESTLNGKRIILFEIQATRNQPVRFMGIEYIRIGSYTKKLQEYPEKERALWRIFDKSPFEEGIAKSDATSDDVLSLINYPKFFEMMKQQLPDNRVAILARLESEQVILMRAKNRYDISNLGAILFAKNLKYFSQLNRKSLRVIIYKGNNRVETIKEQTGGKGYAVGFEGAIRYINDQLPQNEQIGQALRSEVRTYPEIAIRELIANALIHQDFSIAGAGPMVEIFSDRMEITNPGKPLIDTLRFIDEPPRSRNEILAALMRRLSICEERGSGIDKVISFVELFQLPAPDFRVSGNNMIAVLFGPRKFSQMDRDERIRACYQHACLQFISGTRMANASLRKRLGIEKGNYPIASRIIRDTIDAGLLKTHDDDKRSKRDATYVPFWA